LGHLFLSGYNEVTLLRRLPKGHDLNAMLNALGGDVFQTPHHNEFKVLKLHVMVGTLWQLPHS
jgi:hypothetical protein